MRPPIVIAGDGDLVFYKSELQVQLYAEVQDIEGSSRVAYDSDGRLLKLDIREVQRRHRFLCLRWTDRKMAVVVSEVRPTVDLSGELRSKLMGFLQSAGYSLDELASRSMDELVSLAWKRRL